MMLPKFLAVFYSATANEVTLTEAIL